MEAQKGKNHENLQFGDVRNPQNRPKALILAILEIFGKPKMVKIMKICNFVLSAIRKIGQKALVLAILDVFWKPKMVKNHENLQFCGHFGGFLGSPKWSKITKICNFALSGIRKIGQKALILAILEIFGKPKMVKNHENLQFCAFRNPQNRPKRPYFSHFGGFWQAENGQNHENL